MIETDSFFTITLHLHDPIEISDFAAVFDGIASLFDDYLRENQPDLRGKAFIYIKDIRRGSIVADLFPNIPDMIGYMDNTLIVLGFGALFSKRIRSLINGMYLDGASKSDIQEIGKTIRAVSNDSGGSMTLETINYKNGIFTKELNIELTNNDAKKAKETLQRQIKEDVEPAYRDYKRVIMTFERSRKSTTDLEKTGELVVIEEVSPKPSALVYGSELIEGEIKREIRESDDNIFKKGFVVDVRARVRAEKISAYIVLFIHQIIDLND